MYDFKYSGEHRVRLVFDGSRQGTSTYKETYTPTARQESVRLFHVVLVEENWGLGQYDVPQAFLKALIDYVIFACHDSNPVCQIRYTSTYMYKCQRTHGLPSGNSDEREMRKTEVKIIFYFL